MRTQALTPVGQKLLKIYERLFDCYGPQHWWPADEPFEVVVGTILTQSTAWTNVEKAINSLKKEGILSPHCLYQIPLEELAKLVRPSGYYNAKALKLKAFVQRLVERYGGELDNLFALDLNTLRPELLSIYGIGNETADSIILYAARKPIFVIDAYTHRIMQRLGLASGKESYTDLQRLFMDNLPNDEALFNEYHALIVRHGKECCRKRPVGNSCCLKELCHNRLDTGLI